MSVNIENSIPLGNQAIKIPADNFPIKDEQTILKSKDIYVYSNMLKYCETNLAKMAISKNIYILEFNALFDMHCSQYEKLYYNGLRKKYRERYYEDQKKEFYMPTGEMYHPYNPYLQKYHGSYLRTYQEF